MPRLIKECVFGLVTAAALLAGCTPTQYAAQADRSAYKTLEKGQKISLGETYPFNVIYEKLGRGPEGKDIPIRINGKVIPFDDKAKPAELTVDDCLEIAFRNSRDFQNRKEELYTAALALANTRRGWNIPLLSGDLDAQADWEQTLREPESKSASAELGPTLTQRFISGGILTLAGTLDWMTDFILGSESNIVNSLLEANFTQPLLQGAWRGFAYEDQYRLERNFLFTVFDFDRFRQTFATGIFTNYYTVLLQRDRLENESDNIKRLERTLATTTALVDGGFTSRMEQDEAESNLLSAQVTYQRNRQNYQNALDLYKITLGLPIQTRVELDYPRSLESLGKAGLKPLGIEEFQAVATALSVRPDVLTQRAAVRDAGRDVIIAADAFNPQLDVEVGLSVPGTPPRKFDRLQFHRRTRYAGVTFNYALDQTDNRDDYRLAIMAHNRAQRDLEGFIDRVRLEVRQAYRELIQSQRSYEIQLRNVKIAERRRALASLKQKEGTASARDVLTSYQALLNAKNGLTSALISYATTRVQFLATLGMIYVDKRGLLHEQDEPFKFDRIQERYPYVGENETLDPSPVSEMDPAGTGAGALHGDRTGASAGALGG